MGLETFSFITSLNSSNPIHATDQVSEGDDHLRGIKLTLLNSFPNVDAAVNLTPTEFNYLDGVTGVTGTGKLVLDTAPTLGVVTVTSIGGILEADLVDKSAAETISGAWDFDLITATSYDGVLAGNLCDAAGNGTISGTWDFTTAPQMVSIEVGHATDTTLSRGAAGKLEVEGKPIIAHNDGTLGSGEVYLSTSDPSGGADGDIWFKHEA